MTKLWELWRLEEGNLWRIERHTGCKDHKHPRPPALPCSDPVHNTHTHTHTGASPARTIDGLIAAARGSVAQHVSSFCMFSLTQHRHQSKFKVLDLTNLLNLGPFQLSDLSFGGQYQEQPCVTSCCPTNSGARNSHFAAACLDCISWCCVFVCTGRGGRQGGQFGAASAGGRWDCHHQRHWADRVPSGGRRSDKRIVQDSASHRPQVHTPVVKAQTNKTEANGPQTSVSETDSELSASTQGGYFSF